MLLLNSERFIRLNSVSVLHRWLPSPTYPLANPQLKAIPAQPYEPYEPYAVWKSDKWIDGGNEMTLFSLIYQCSSKISHPEKGKPVI